MIASLTGDICGLFCKALCAVPLVPFIAGRFCQGDGFELCLYIDIIPTCWSWRQEGYGITFIFKKQKYLQVGVCVCMCVNAQACTFMQITNIKFLLISLRQGLSELEAHFCLGWIHSKLQARICPFLPPKLGLHSCTVIHSIFTWVLSNSVPHACAASALTH